MYRLGSIEQIFDKKILEDDGCLSRHCHTYDTLDEASKIEAEQQLLNIEAASYPNMDKSSRRRIDRHYNRIVSPPTPATKDEQESSWKILRARAPQKARKNKP